MPKFLEVTDSAAARSVIGVSPAREVTASNNTDDTAAIQAFLNDGGTIVFPAGGTWLVNAETTLSPVSDSRIVIEPGAELRVIANNAEGYELFNLDNVDNVTIEGGGTLRGDVGFHTGEDGEFGHLVFVTNGCSNITIRDITVTKAWGDGIYVGGGSSACTNIVIERVTAIDNRRNGISPFWVDGCVVRHCHMLDTGLSDEIGPCTGLDCEPNPGQTTNRLTVENNLVENCKGIGMLISDNSGVEGSMTNIIVRDNTVVNCGRGFTGIYEELYKFNGIHVAGTTSPLLIDNIVRSCGTESDPGGGPGQIIVRDCPNAVIRGGHLLDGLNMGLYVWASPGSVVDSVVVEGSAGPGLWVYACDDVTIINSRFINNCGDDGGTDDHVHLNTADDCLVKGNTFSGSNGRSWIRVQSTADNAAVVANTGLGTSPTEVLSNAATTTAQFANTWKNTTAFDFWDDRDDANKPNIVALDPTNIAAGCNFEGDEPFAMPVSTWAIATDQYKTGTQSLKISQTSGTNSVEFATNAEAGDQFYVHFWARKDSSWNGSTNSRFRVGHSAANTLVSVYSISSNVTSNDTWTELSFTATAPAGATSMRFALQCDSTAGNLWIDDITIRRVQSANTVPAVVGRVAVPATTSSTGTTGQYAADTSYFYICVATNSWRRVAVGTW